MNQRIIVSLDGNPVAPNEIEGWDGSITVSRRASDIQGDQFGGAASVSGPARTFSGSLTLYGSAAEYVRERLFGADGQNNAIAVEFFSTCCNKVVFVGEIRRDGLGYCAKGEDCGITVAVADASPEAAAITLLKNKVIKGYDMANPRPNFYTDTAHPFVRHCNALRPKALAAIMIIVAFGLNTLFGFMVPFVTIVSILASIVPGTPTFGAPTQLIQSYLGFIDTLEQLATGCGNGHPTPFVTSYLNQITTLTGLRWESTMFFLLDPAGNDIAPFRNAMWWCAPIDGGTRTYQNPDGSVIYEVGETYWQKNAPNESCYEWLDLLCRALGLRWWIEGSTIRIETVVPTTPTVFDLRTWPDIQVKRVCYDLTGQKSPAYARLKFSDDGQDVPGDEAAGNYIAPAPAYYDAIVDYNTPPPPGRQGPLDITLPVGRARFNNDEFGADELAPFANIPFVANTIGNARHWLKLSMGKASLPKVLMWDGADLIEAQVERVDVGGGVWQYNNTFKFRPGEPNSLWELSGFKYLAQRRYGAKAGQTIRVTLAASCEALDNISVGGGLIDYDGDTAVITDYVIDAQDITINAKF